MVPKAPGQSSLRPQPEGAPASPAPYTNGSNGKAVESRAPISPQPDAPALAPVKAPRGWKGTAVGLLVALVFVLGALALVYHYYFRPQAEGSGTAATGSSSGGKHGGKNRMDSVRVVTSKAVKGNIGVYLVGLGSVTPRNSVTLRTRVDGQLMQVNYTEGQMVHKGDHLVKIDDRPYLAQLAQYKAQKEHDEAVTRWLELEELR